jgi:hypothetical protein
MTADPKILDFIAGAKAKGATEQSLVGILTARGWSEKEIYEALASQYEQATGLSVPHRGGSGTAAKDAFFYLLIFSTLATYYRGDDMYSAAASMASIFVAFPIYLLVSRSVLSEEREHPEKLNSPVRKWLTYMALVIAACVFIGDLIAALNYLLRGEITSRFLAKAFVVLVISGGVFFYYFGGLKRSEAGTQSQTHRDRWLAVLSALAVTIAVILGFLYIGAPSTQRTLRADGKRVQDVYQLTMKIDGIWAKNHKLPEHLDEVPNSILADPVTRAAYEYHAKEGSQYDLCATFEMPSRQNNSPNSRAWAHPAGRHCFSIDASQATDSPWVYTY